MLDPVEMKERAEEAGRMRKLQGISPERVEAAIEAERARWEAKSRLGQWLEWQARWLASLAQRKASTE
jgi:hypothetical protein